MAAGKQQGQSHAETGEKKETAFAVSFLAVGLIGAVGIDELGLCGGNGADDGGSVFGGEQQLRLTCDHLDGFLIGERFVTDADRPKDIFVQNVFLLHQIVFAAVAVQ